MRQKWQLLWTNKRYLYSWVSLLVLAVVSLMFMCSFLCYNEARTGGAVLDDYILNLVEPADVSVLLFSITWIAIGSFIPFLLLSPKSSMQLFLATILIVIFRCITLYLFPLEPPAGIIPLRDPLLERSFYDSQVMVRDLFFSGHTANLSILFFLVERKWAKYLIGMGTCAVACLLLVQHVHYSVDILFAPLFAFAAAFLAKSLSEIIYRWSRPSSSMRDVSIVQ